MAWPPPCLRSRSDLCLFCLCCRSAASFARFFSISSRLLSDMTRLWKPTGKRLLRTGPSSSLSYIHLLRPLPSISISLLGLRSRWKKIENLMHTTASTVSTPSDQRLLHHLMSSHRNLGCYFTMPMISYIVSLHPLMTLSCTPKS